MCAKAEHDELACVYAGLLLFDEKIEISADKINKILSASGNKVDDYYPEFFASYLKTANINSLLTASVAPASGETHAEAASDKKDDKKKDKKDDKKKKEKEKPKEEEDDDEMPLDLF